MRVHITGAESAIRDFTKIERNLLKPNVQRRIFKKAMKPTLTKSRSFARNITNQDGKKMANRHQIARAISYKTPKSRKAAVYMVGLNQKKLPTTSSTTGQSYKAHGRSGVPIGHFFERGTKERRGDRGRIRGSFFLFRALQRTENEVIRIADSQFRVEAKRIDPSLQTLIIR